MISLSTTEAMKSSATTRIRGTGLVVVHLCAALLFTGFLGCDKLQPKQEEPPKQAAAPKPQPQPQPAPQVVQQAPKVEVPVAPPKPTADDVLAEIRNLQSNKDMSQMTDEALIAASELDEEHRAAVTTLYCNRAGKVTLKGIQVLHKFPNLNSLGVDELPFGKDPSRMGELSTLTNLETLTLNRCGLVDADLQYLKPLKKLRELILDNNTSITDNAFVFLKDLPSLERIDLNYCSINGTGFLAFKQAKIKSPIKIIVAHHTRFAAGGMKAIDGWKNLEQLHCSQCGVNDVELQGLRGLSNLKALSLGWDSFTILGLKNAKIPLKQKLEVLSIENVGGFDDVCLAEFSKCKNLKKVTLSQTRVTQAGVDRLKKVLKDVEVKYYP